MTRQLGAFLILVLLGAFPVAMLLLDPARSGPTTSARANEGGGAIAALADVVVEACIKTGGQRARMSEAAAAKGWPELIADATRIRWLARESAAHHHITWRHRTTLAGGRDLCLVTPARDVDRAPHDAAVELLGVRLAEVLKPLGAEVKRSPRVRSIKGGVHHLDVLTVTLAEGRNTLATFEVRSSPGTGLLRQVMVTWPR